MDDMRARLTTFLAVLAVIVAITGTGTVAGDAAPPPVPIRPIVNSVAAPPPPPPSPSPLPPRAAPVVLVVGDSIAESVGQAMADAAAPGGTAVIDAAVEGCGVMAGTPLHYVGHEQPQPDTCDDWPARWQAEVDADLPNVSMLMVGRWEVVDRVVDGDWRAIGDPVFDQELTARLERAVQILTSRGGSVVVTTAPYFRRAIAPDGSLYPEDEPSRVDTFDAAVRALAARHPGQVTVADFGGELSPDGMYADDVAGVRVRRDGVHLTPEGCSMAAGWLLPQVLAAAAGPIG